MSETQFTRGVDYCRVFGGGVKYEYLTEILEIQTDIRLGVTARLSEYVSLSTKGVLTIRRGFLWDGASGGIDTPSNMRGSMVHDALCEMIEKGLLHKSWQKTAERLLCDICIEDGMSSFRAWYWYRFVRRYQRWQNKKLKGVSK